MAHQLSGHLAAMRLNVEAGFVGGTGHYPAFDGIVNELIALANDSLRTAPFTPSGHPERAYQEQLKNHLDALNNGVTVIPAKPCARTFPTN